jgi:ATP-dependent RNA helicase DeaD
LTGKPLERKKVPGGKEICEIQLLSMMEKIEKVTVDDIQIEKYMPAICRKLDHLNKEELIKLFVSIEFNRFLAFYKNAPDLNVTENSIRESDKNSAGERGKQKNRFKSSSAFGNINRSDRKRKDIHFSRFYINLGSRRNINALKLIALINSQTRIRNIEIGKIDIERNFSFFEADSRYASEIETSFKNLSYENIPVILNRSDAKRNNLLYEKDYRSGNKRVNRKHSSCKY